MLPPGHMAAGYLTAYAFLKIVRPDFAPSQISEFLLLGVVFGFAPDLDMFLAFAKEKSFIIKDFQRNNHRKSYFHAPALWLIAGLLIYFLSQNIFGKSLGLLLWLASWSHFFLDSFEDGIMWLWPFSNHIYGFNKPKSNIAIGEHNFFAYWFKFLRLYMRSFTFYLEILIILTVLLVHFR